MAEQIICIPISHTSSKSWHILTCLILCVLMLSYSLESSARATITLVNLNSAGVGLNDPTPVTPIGGNNGTTLGAQRQNALIYTAELLSVMLHSDVPIEIGVSFGNLGGTSQSAPLAESGPNTYHYNFTGAINTLTWFPQPLANKLAGQDVAPASSCLEQSISVTTCYDIAAEFNSQIDTSSALADSTWYYGLDAPSQTDPSITNQFDLVTVALHELLHGVGLISLMDVSNGDFFYSSVEDNELPDQYTLLLARQGVTPTGFGEMTNAQRLQAIIADGSVYWSGSQAAVIATNSRLGTLAGQPLIYTPNPVELGATLAHLDTSFSPNQTMEPFYTSATHDIGIAAGMLSDMGWGALADLSVSMATAANPAPINQATNYQFAASNFGVQASPETTIVYTLPTGTTFANATPDICSAQGNEVSCDIGELGAGKTTSLTMALVHTTVGQITHQAEIYGDIVDNRPNNNSTTLTISSANQIPNLLADAGEDLSGISGETVTLDATASNVVTGVIQSYSFELVNGSKGTITQNSSGQADVLLPEDGSDVVIRVTVEDDSGNSSSDFIKISANLRPTTDAGEDQSVNTQQLVTLSGTATDSDGSVVSFLWQQISGTSVTLSNPQEATTTFSAPAQSTTLQFSLTTTDNEGATSTDTVTISVSTPASSGGGAFSELWLALLSLLWLTRLVFFSRRFHFS